MAQVHISDGKPAQGITTQPGTSYERTQSTGKVLIVFLIIIIGALVACALFQHAAYTQIKRHDNTSSADDLNGQSPSNTLSGATNSAPTAGAAPGPVSATPGAMPNTHPVATAASSSTKINNTPVNSNVPAGNASAPVSSR